MNASQSKNQLNYLVAVSLACLACFAAMPSAALAADAPAADTNTTTAQADVLSNRMSRKLGFNLGIGDPAPGVGGINVAYNVTDFLRVSAGYGQVSETTSLDMDMDGNITTHEASASAIGFGARAFVPGWNLTPTVGLHYAHISYSGDGTSVAGFSDSGSQIFTTLGVDWQAKNGFNASAGLEYSFKDGVGSSAYLTVGWFFNWLG